MKHDFRNLIPFYYGPLVTTNPQSFFITNIYFATICATNLSTATITGSLLGVIFFAMYFGAGKFFLQYHQ